jgi:hypothetical protein
MERPRRHPGSAFFKITRAIATLALAAESFTPRSPTCAS